MKNVNIDKGFIIVPRSFFKNKKWQTDRAFSEAEAWLDLIQSARYESTEITSRIGCYEVTWGRGEFPASYRMLSARWGRSVGWIKSLLVRLKRAHCITSESRQGLNVIRICDYELYSGRTREERSLGDDTDHVVSEQRQTPDTLEQTPATSYNKRGKKNMFSKENERELTCAHACVKEETATATRSDCNEPVETIEPVETVEPPASHRASPASPCTAYSKEAVKTVASEFNRAVQGRRIPRIISLSERRRQAVGGRLSEHGMQAVLTVIRRAADSCFLNGSGEKGWHADFDWIFRPNNFIKILEGNYDNQPNTPPRGAAISLAGTKGSQSRADGERQQRDREFAAHIAAKLNGSHGVH